MGPGIRYAPENLQPRATHRRRAPVEGQYVEGNIIRVAPLSIFARESDEKVKAQQASEKAEPLETRMFPISYAEVAIVESAVKNARILSPRGSLSVDKRTSSMLDKGYCVSIP